MKVFHQFAKSDADGVLHLDYRVPAGEYEVLVVLSRKPVLNLPKDRPPTPEELGWPPGYLESTYGAIKDESFVAPPRQLPLPPPVEFT